ncbi:MAG: putative signal transduction protein with EFhand domain [Polaromonas sp.]|nr:putative signal transduction protein with EFhand domain [Polaromonas sp.]
MNLLALARALLLSAGAAAVLLAGNARAQDPPAPAFAQAAASAPAEAASAPPRYAANDLAQAFKFMDSNGDGQVDREEAARFRGVTRHFDQADTNHDGFLSRKEFDTAMNHVKSK